MMQRFYALKRLLVKENTTGAGILQAFFEKNEQLFIFAESLHKFSLCYIILRFCLAFLTSKC